ncbi:hypothetical protein [Archangium lansingense]|uniref:Uncharacterized protein n=1 Tax=Archangium lansingense TaxID=2995310 RepID=A0ABT4AAP0_9BACT|nr:hypothetical protein [Archangium lansinium]MCY1078685.1 hypothetical protein [Archangium lansinium]
MATLICTLEMDKEKGLTIKVEDPDGKLTQTVTIDGKAITLEVKNDSDTSTVVQKPDAVTITCKTFTVEADTIKLESKKDSEWRSSGELKFASEKDMSLTSSAKLTQKASKDASLTSDADIQLKASAELKLEGKTSKLEAKGEGKALELKGPLLKLNGTQRVVMWGRLLKVAATGELNLESKGPANLKGGTTNVKGSPVNLG